jgi:hypothetical protein
LPHVKEIVIIILITELMHKILSGGGGVSAIRSDL